MYLYIINCRVMAGGPIRIDAAVFLQVGKNTFPNIFGHTSPKKNDMLDERLNSLRPTS